MFDDSEDALQRIASELKRPVSVSSTFDTRVMRVVRNTERPTKPRLWKRLMSTRTVTVTPLRRAALAASLVGAVTLGVIGPRLVSTLDHAQRAMFGTKRTPSAQRVQFVLVAPTARKVAVVGDFNGWDATHAAYQARHRGGGVWSVTAPVPVGHHRYSFVVDDTVWMADPTAPRVIDNDFGLPNSALVVEENP